MEPTDWYLLAAAFLAGVLLGSEIALWKSKKVIRDMVNKGHLYWKSSKTGKWTPRNPFDGDFQ